MSEKPTSNAKRGGGSMGRVVRRIATRPIPLGMVLCVVGAIVIDCGILVTGCTLFSLGVWSIILGPLAVDL